MTTPATPILLLDNVFDTGALYPGAVLSASSEAVGHEVFRVVDCRRDRSYWQATGDLGGAGNHYITVDLGAFGPLAVDCFLFDRGNTLGGRTLYLEGSNDAFATVAVSVAINYSNTWGPGVAPVGSDWPTFVTEELCFYGLAPAPTTPCTQWRLRVPASGGYVPTVTGLLLGARITLLNYLKTFDEDAGGRTQSSDVSDAGQRGAARTYAWRTVALDMGTIGATEYDATIRTARELMFRQNQPWFCALDYVTRPERMWLYRYDGEQWAAPKNRVYRTLVVNGREEGALV